MMEPEDEHEPAPQVGDEANTSHTEVEREDKPVSAVVARLDTELFSPGEQTMSP
jgi:hypothetical protein